MEELTLSASLSDGVHTTLTKVAVNVYTNYDSIVENIGIYRRFMKYNVSLEAGTTYLDNQFMNLNSVNGLLQRFSLVKSDVSDISLKLGDVYPEDVPKAIRKITKSIHSKGTGSLNTVSTHYSRNFNNNNLFTGVDLPVGKWELKVECTAKATVSSYLTFLCGNEDAKSKIVNLLGR